MHGSFSTVLVSPGPKLRSNPTGLRDTHLRVQSVQRHLLRPLAVQLS
jgi:hypothetical protein